MKKLGIVLVVLAAIALVYAPVMAADKAAAPAAPAAAKKDVVKPAKVKKEPVTVTGVVTEVKNKKGKVIGAAIQTDKDTITVVKKGKGADLFKMMGKKIEATGTVAEKKGKKYIYVKSYKDAM
jgi:DNA/RNA endonuclease YhcR with UshA esterase domain